MHKFKHQLKGNRAGYHLQDYFIPTWRLNLNKLNRSSYYFVKRSKPQIFDVRIAEMKKNKSPIILFNGFFTL